MEDVVKLIVDNGVTVGVIFYFMWRDSKFMGKIDNTLTALKEVIDSLNDKFTNN